MTRRLPGIFIITVLTAFLLSGPVYANTLSAEVTLQSVSGTTASGFAVFTPHKEGLEVTGFLRDMPPGTYRLLIDEGASCTAATGIAISTTPVINTDQQGRLKFISILPVLTIEQGNRTIIGRRAIIQATETRTAIACGQVRAR